MRRPILAAATALALVMVTPCAGGAAKLARSTTPRPTTTGRVPTSAGTTSAALPASGRLARFEAASVSFVSTQVGWVLGSASCGTGECAPVLLHTENGGKSWTPIPTPPVVVDAATAEVRFANPRNGWVIGASRTGYSAQLWATHDGGAQWEQPPMPAPLANDEVQDLETAAGSVHAGFCGSTTRIGTSPVQLDHWVASPTALQSGAGPVCDPQIVLQGTAGWLVNVDRTVIDGARLQQGAWVPWNPPCMTAVGPGEVAAPNTTDLVAVCDVGVWSNVHPRVTVSFSSNGGITFRPVVATLPSNAYGPVASPRPGVVVVGSSAGNGLLATFDEGSTWKVVYHQPTSQGCNYVGFTTAAQGVAIETDGTMLMTFNGGHRWSPVRFPRVRP